MALVSQQRAGLSGLRAVGKQQQQLCTVAMGTRQLRVRCGARAKRLSRHGGRRHARHRLEGACGSALAFVDADYAPYNLDGATMLFALQNPQRMARRSCPLWTRVLPTQHMRTAHLALGSSPLTTLTAHPMPLAAGPSPMTWTWSPSAAAPTRPRAAGARRRRRRRPRRPRRRPRWDAGASCACGEAAPSLVCCG